MRKLYFGFRQLILFFYYLMHIAFELCRNIFDFNAFKKTVINCGKVLSSFNQTMSIYFKPSRIPKIVTDHYGYNSLGLEKLVATSRNLHMQLPNPTSFSIMIPVYHPNHQFFREMLVSVANQSSPNFEIILGYDGQHEAVYSQIVSEIRAQSLHTKIHEHTFLRSETEAGGISRTTNKIAAKAVGEYLILMDHDDWIRPDLLFRYEQTLKLVKNPESMVLYCNEYKINQHSKLVEGSKLCKPEHPEFPYMFINFIAHCLMVPRKMWNQIGGCRPETDGSQDFDLCLRLDLQGAVFQCVPLYMYAWRMHPDSTAQSAGAKNYTTEAGKKALTDYFAKKGIQADVTDGLIPTTYRPVFKTQVNHKIHVIIPYKDNGEMTIKCVEYVKAQTYSQTIYITCVDNNSTDTQIADNLMRLGVEVLSFKEGFNYSRINNFAVKNSKYTDSDVLLFLNNDVYLENKAIEEMAQWVSQPRIGLIGARLNYDDGTIQHGGVRVGDGPIYNMNWHHMGLQPADISSIFAHTITVTDAVTGACMMIKRDVFNQVGGFDEIWHPIAFSDTDLCSRVRRKGLLCLYTPFAVGVHLESKTRGYNAIEDYEASSWLYKNIHRNDKPFDKFIRNSLIDLN